MGKYLSKPVTSKECEKGTGPDFNWGSAAMQGWRVTMEDKFILQPTFGHLKTFSLFLVLDGFGGFQCAEQVSQNFSSFMVKHETFMNLKDGDEYDSNEVADAFKQSLLNFDEKMSGASDMGKCGCTVTGTLITPNHFIIVNLGDSRTIVCREKEVFFTTTDHSPSAYKERERIEAAGGFVSKNRINGDINISRALGNFPMKNDTRKRKICQILSPEADVTVLNRSKEKDDFIAIASDGVFRSFSNAELVDYFVKRIPYKRHLDDLAGDVLDYCCHAKSRDNLTLILLHFDNSKIQRDEEKIDEDEELDETIRGLTREYIKQAFADGRQAYGWEPCFRQMEKQHGYIFSDEQNTQNLGIQLKKGVIYAEFDKGTSAIKNARRKKAWELLQEQEKKKSDN